MQELIDSPEMTLEDHLKKLFGYNEFRHLQKQIVTSILNKKDVLAILPTGAGKSICYQLPAMLMPGTAIVISPLISLMQDQVVSLTKNNIPAAFLNSSLHFEDIRDVINNIGSYKLLYVAPERFADQNFVQALQQVLVSFFAIDEAHCISQWGHSFRPEYRQLSLLKKHFPSSPIIALTATATQDVELDIASQLLMSNQNIVKASFDRPNLTIRAEPKTDLLTQIQAFLNKHTGESGIIYGATRKVVDEVYNSLTRLGLQVGKYHAGMSDEQRSKAQHEFVYGQTHLMVATIAFGMGIHKPDIRFIIHANMPRSLEQYYQEIGRAGRDGLPAECLMLYSGQDQYIYELFLSDLQDEKVKRLTEGKTKKMTSFCYSSSCRRRDLLKYFGESYQAPNCNNCDNCLDGFDLVDETVTAQKILSCVFKLNQNFGVNHVIEVLRGAKTKTVFAKGHESLSTYGLMKECSEENLRIYINSLISMNFLSKTPGEYPVLQWTDKSRSVINGKEKFIMRKVVQHNTAKKKTMSVDYDIQLFSKLSQLRQKFAKEANVPAYVVFGDRPLIEMATSYPVHEDAFLSISGVGPVKWERYGQAFLDVIKTHCSENSIEPKGQKTPKMDRKPFVGEREAERKPVKSTRGETVRLFQQGYSIDEIAESRGLVKGTVLMHLAEEIAGGKDIDITPIVSLERQQAISAVIAMVGLEKMIPIKDKLPEDYSFGEIRLVIAMHQKPV